MTSPAANILEKEIGLFVENNIGSYKRSEDVSFSSMINVFLENDGFFVVENSDQSFKCYLDVSDVTDINKLISEFKSDPSKLNALKVSELISQNRIKFRTESIDYSKKLGDVIADLKKTSQKFFPVVKGNRLLGRISKEILLEKLSRLYDISF